MADSPKVALARCVLALASACGSGAPPLDRVQAPIDSPPAVVAQIERGKHVFAEQCASCHGAAGQGVVDRGPSIMGEGALPRQPRAGSKRDALFRSAADVVAWTADNMPSDAPASLTADQYLAIVAFQLAANRLHLKAPLDSQSAATLVLDR